MTERESAIRDRVRSAQRIMVLTGAGMSAESGIPTFRDPQTGLWANFDPMTLATANAFRQDPALVWGWYLWRMHLVRSASPNDGHFALAELQARTSELKIFTQNVDDLHERAGSTDVHHLHGSLFAVRCFACARPVSDPIDASAAPTTQKVKPPSCQRCGGRIRPGVVWFGESLPERVIAEAIEFAGRCDVMVVIGTSGLVSPASQLPIIASKAGAYVIEINPTETAVTKHANVSLRVQATVGCRGLI